MRKAILAAAIFGLALLGWAVAWEPGRLVVRAVDVGLPDWPAELSGLRVAAMGDVHTGSPHVDLPYLTRVVERTNAEHPDLVVLLGDYVIHDVVGGRFVEPEATARVLAGLRARHGVFAVLGNHDWWLDGERVRRALSVAGITVLENDAAAVVVRGRRLWVAGLADLWTRRPDVEQALARVPEGEPVLMLTHGPDVFPEVPGRVSLTLAAHTHGGQVALPLLGRPVVPSRYGQRYAAGLVEEEGRALFVTTGVGTSIMPVRFRVPPEVAVLILRPSRP